MVKHNKDYTLHYSIKKGKINHVKHLITLGGSIYGLDNRDNTPFHIACSRNHTDICELLIDMGGSTDKQNRGGNTPLHFMCKHSNLSLVKKYIELYGISNVLNNDNNTPIRLACKYGHIEIVGYLLSRETRLVESILFMDAVENQNIDMINVLLDNIDTSTSDINFTKLLARAIYKKNIEIIKFFVSRTNIDYNTHIFSSAFRFICSSYNKQNVSENNLDIIEYLIEFGIKYDITKYNYKDGKNGTYLHNHNIALNVMELLITMECPIDTPDNDSKLPIHFYDLERTKKIVNADSPINVKDQYGNTPLMLSHDPELTIYLIEAGALINETNNYGSTALLIAVNDDLTCHEIAKILIDHGANPNIKNTDGNTPLILSINPETTIYLIEAGALIDETNNEGDTSLHIVISYMQKIDDIYHKCANILIDCGANPYIENLEGETPYDLINMDDGDNSIKRLFNPRVKNANN